MPRTSISGSQHTFRSLDDYVGHWLRRAHQAAGATLARHIREHDVTPAQLATLLRLREVGRISQNELGRAVAMERANIHRIVDGLSGRGLVLVAADPSDARKNVLSLSQTGRDLVERLEPLHADATNETMRTFTPAERERLLELLQKFCAAAHAVS